MSTSEYYISDILLSKHGNHNKSNILKELGFIINKNIQSLKPAISFMNVLFYHKDMINFISSINKYTDLYSNLGYKITSNRSSNPLHSSKTAKKLKKYEDQFCQELKLYLPSFDKISIKCSKKTFINLNNIQIKDNILFIYYNKSLYQFNTTHDKIVKSAKKSRQYLLYTYRDKIRYSNAIIDIDFNKELILELTVINNLLNNTQKINTLINNLNKISSNLLNSPEYQTLLLKQKLI